MNAPNFYGLSTQIAFVALSDFVTVKSRILKEQLADFEKILFIINIENPEH